MRIFIIYLVFVSVQFDLQADFPLAPKPVVFASSGERRAIFTMLPPVYDADKKLVREAFGVAYLLQPDGSLKELYRTIGWYSSEVFITDDGRNLIQMGPWNFGESPSEADLALAFIKDGKEIKRYSTADLVKDPTQVLATISHYQWRAPDFIRRKYKDNEALALLPRLDESRREFILHTIDGWTYYFNAQTGQLNKSEKTKS